MIRILGRLNVIDDTKMRISMIYPFELVCLLPGTQIEHDGGTFGEDERR
jgi:hypothetical protein